MSRFVYVFLAGSMDSLGGQARRNYFESVNYSLINRCFGQIPGEIVLGLFELTSLRSVNSEKPRTISPGIDLNIG